MPLDAVDITLIVDGMIDDDDDDDDDNDNEKGILRRNALFLLQDKTRDNIRMEPLIEHANIKKKMMYDVHMHLRLDTS